jgi:hypothetical protein
VDKSQEFMKNGEINAYFGQILLINANANSKNRLLTIQPQLLLFAQRSQPNQVLQN